MSVESSLALGFCIDERLRLIEVIGEGSSGVVYLAEDLSNTSKRFAVKRLDRAAMDTQDLEDFRREVFVLKRLSGHPNIVSFHKLIETSEFYYLVMEHCETDLFDAIFLRCGFPPALIKRFFGNIADGLAFCHQNGIFHRDIKVCLYKEMLIFNSLKMFSSTRMAVSPKLQILDWPRLTNIRMNSGLEVFDILRLNVLDLFLRRTQVNCLSIREVRVNVTILPPPISGRSESFYST